uniref:Uncharacterized protein n=1 Tax=Solanum lycopersicum TaxID=4081 RepID=A0A3Q7F4M0_SOLLC
MISEIHIVDINLLETESLCELMGKYLIIIKVQKFQLDGSSANAFDLHQQLTNTKDNSQAYRKEKEV